MTVDCLVSTHDCHALKVICNFECAPKIAFENQVGVQQVKD